MRIAQVAPLQIAVPPRNYGGTERVIANLTDALVARGHEVTLFASGDSRTRAQRRFSAIPQALNFQPGEDAVARHIALLTMVYSRAAEFDVIHSHLDYLTLPFAARCPTPTVVTLHGRLDLVEHSSVLRRYADAGAISFVAISHDQRQSLTELRWAATIYHGLDIATFPFSPRPGSYLAFVGRISPEKGPDRAIAIARRSGIPLKIAAKVDPNDEAYFETVVKPLLDNPLVEFLGPVDEQRKRALMRDALALLLPITWPEPFGLVFLESLACGTPVLTCPQGSVPELLADGVTGFIRQTDDELVEAVSQVARLSRDRCRAYVRQRFDTHRMAREYEQVYEAARASDGTAHADDSIRGHVRPQIERASSLTM